MPAALLENTPQDDFGLNLANRKCSERRNVSRLLHQRSGTAKGKRKASARSGTESRERQSGVAVTEPPGGKQRSQDRSRPPDGTGRRQGGRAMKAGSFGNHRDADPSALVGSDANRCKWRGKRHKAIAQNRPGTCRRSWGWRQRRPHLLLGADVGQRQQVPLGGKCPLLNLLIRCRLSGVDILRTSRQISYFAES